MPVTVHVPIRLRVSPADLRDGGVRVDDLLAEGLARALARSRDVAVAPRGSYMQVRFHPPEISWGGAGVNAIGDALRRTTEARVARVVEAAVAASGISALADAAWRAPEVLPANPSEALDRRRTIATGGAYVVPSYGDGDGTPGRRVIYLEDLAAAQAASAALLPGTAGLFVRYTSEEALREALTYVAGRYLENRPVPGTGRIGGIYTRSYRGATTYWAYVATVSLTSGGVALGSRIADWPIGSPGQSHLGDRGETEGQVRIRMEPYGAYFLSSFRRGEGQDAFREAWVAVNRDIVSGRAQEIVARLANEGHTVALDEVEAALEAGIERLAREMAGDWAPWMGGLANLQHPNGGTTHAWLHKDLPDETVTLLPLIEIGEAPPARPPGDGSGGDGAGGDGAGGDGGQGSGGNGSGSGSGATPGTGGGGDVDGEPAGAGPAPIAVTGEAGAAGGPGRRWPVRGGLGEVIELDFGPFKGEPSVDELGRFGQTLWRLIQRIAYRLDMPTCKYAAAFSIAAEQMLRVRASGVASYAVGQPSASAPVENRGGNLGEVQFEPLPSPAIQFMRHLGATTPIITQLVHLIDRGYTLPQFAAHFTGSYRNDPMLWLLRFHEALTPEIKESVARIYQYTCQIVLLQLLRHSREQIQLRLTNFDRYFPLFEQLITAFLANQAELERLRGELVAFRANFSPTAVVQEAYHSWRAARRAFSTSLSDQVLNLSDLVTPNRGPSALISRRADGEWVIADDAGRSWTMAELEQAIALRNGTAQALDPLVEQIADMESVVVLFREHPQLSRVYLRSLLDEMLANNTDQTERVTREVMYAFRASKIREDLAQRTVPGTSVALQGVHLLAHEAIGDAFAGDMHYSLGLDWAFGVEQGREMLLSFFEFTGTLLLAVVCPPAAFLVGVGVAAAHYHAASVQEELYQSLIDPELVLSRADVELDLFLGELELALSIIPDAGTIIRGAVSGGRTIARQGLRAGLRSVGRRLTREIFVSMVRQLKDGLVRALVRELVTQEVVGAVVQQIIEPVVAIVYREHSFGAGGPGSAPLPVAPVALDAAVDAPTQPGEAELLRRLDEELHVLAEEDR